MENRKGFIERLKATGYFFPERVEEMLEEEKFKRLPGETLDEDVEVNVVLIRTVVKLITVSESGVEIEMRDGTVMAL